MLFLSKRRNLTFFIEKKGGVMNILKELKIKI